MKVNPSSDRCNRYNKKLKRYSPYFYCRKSSLQSTFTQSNWFDTECVGNMASKRLNCKAAAWPRLKNFGLVKTFIVYGSTVKVCTFNQSKPLDRMNISQLMKRRAPDRMLSASVSSIRPYVGSWLLYYVFTMVLYISLCG
jgi:hypothetical protein